MEERKFIRLKKEEYGIKEYIKRDLGKGKISRLNIEYTPVGEKIVIHTSKPGYVIGRKGEKIGDLTTVLKKRFKLENPHIEIQEIENPLFDAQFVADEIALSLERLGNLKFKVIAYRKLQEIMKAGALGCEIRLTGKLPSDRAKSWRFADGYLKKAGEPSNEIDRAQSTALTKTGVIGVKVAIMSPNAKIYDKIDIDDEMIKKIKREHVDEIEDNKKSRKRIKEVKDNLKDNNIKVSESRVEDAVKNNINSKEDGTAMKIEQEIEEGVSEEDDRDIEKEIKNEKNEKGINIEKNKLSPLGDGKTKKFFDDKENKYKSKKILME